MVEIKEENLKKAYDNGCEDTKRALQLLFPDFEFENEYNLTFEEVLKLPVGTIVQGELRTKDDRTCEVGLKGVGPTYYREKCLIGGLSILGIKRTKRMYDMKNRPISDKFKVIKQ